VFILTARIDQFPRRGGHFLDARNHLATNRTIRIVAVDQGEEVRRDGKGELMTDLLDACALFGRQLDQRFERFQRRDAMAQLPPPIVPFGVRDV
jgi:hypothetical protein